MILQNTSGPGVKRIRKNSRKTFQQHGQQVTAEANMIDTDFLDITLNLSSGKFWPYRKPGHGLEWKMEWNGTEISVWNMEDARME